MPTLPLRYPDIVVVLLGALVALPLGAPVLGYVLGGGGWILSRVEQANRHRWVARFADEPGSVRRAGVNLFEAFGRIWFLAVAIILAAVLGKRADGLTAAIVVMVAYTITFTIRLVSGPPQESK
jgi:hypothetical protein